MNLSRNRNSSNSEVTPPIKWAGGKRSLVSSLSSLFPEEIGPGRCPSYIEPFLGGAAMFFHLNPTSAILADVNADLINMYEQIKNHPNDLMDKLDEFDDLPYDKESYLSVRSDTPDQPLDQAARFILLNRWGFNGLYRVNRRGDFNVPFGRTTSGSRPQLYERDNILGVSRRLQNATLRVASFEETLASADAGDFVYLDPPYHPISATSSFTSYSKDSFSLKDQTRLRDSVLELDRRTKGTARIMLSNSVAPAMVELYERQGNLRLHTVVARRSISRKASTRGAQAELVVTNY